jgi:hypothetical protein
VFARCFTIFVKTGNIAVIKRVSLIMFFVFNVGKFPFEAFKYGTIGFRYKNPTYNFLAWSKIDTV